MFLFKPLPAHSLLYQMCFEAFLSLPDMLICSTLRRTSALAEAGNSCSPIACFSHSPHLEVSIIRFCLAVSVEYFMGFIDGISESLKEDITLETIEADSTIKLDIDFEKLYYNMVEVEAHWLYNLPGWETILPAAKRKELQKAYKTSKTVVKEEKVGRNDACPCGSGKKYKKCCGK